jgi:Protein of unknown function (DUF3572)
MATAKRPDIGTSELAERALDFLAGDPAELAGFMSAAGLSPDELRAQIGSEALDAGLIDYLAHNQAALTAFSANARIPVDAVMRAYHRRNPGG